MSDIDVIGARAVEVDLGRVLVKSLKGLEAVTETAGLEVRDLWRENATATSGRHGKYYPASIQSHRVLAFGGFGVDVEPDAGMKQGGMSFELGSAKQPPHLDGQKAADHLGPLILRRLSVVVSDL